MRKLKRKTKSPRSPWDVAQIKEERKILREFGLRRKKELRGAEFILRNFRRRARILISVKNEKEEKTLLEKLKRMGLITKESPTLDDVLELTVKDILNRRLQTIVYKKGLSNTIKHARQLITHGHVYVGDKKTVYPAYIVNVEEENKISLAKQNNN